MSLIFSFYCTTTHYQIHVKNIITMRNFHWLMQQATIKYVNICIYIIKMYVFQNKIKILIMQNLPHNWWDLFRCDFAPVVQDSLEVSNTDYTHYLHWSIGSWKQIRVKNKFSKEIIGILSKRIKNFTSII